VVETAAKTIAMRLFRTLTLAAFAAGLLAGPAVADPPRDAERAFQATRDGRSMPLPKIEQQVKPRLPNAEYLGPEFDGSTYRLKFIGKDGRVFSVYVDAATGRIKGRTPR
jgi:hypothetical protein